MEHSKNVHSFWEFQVLVGFVGFFFLNEDGNI